MERIGKKSMQNTKRAKEKEMRDRKFLVEAAMNEGVFGKGDLAKYTGIPLHLINNLFQNDRELYAEFCVRRQIIVDMAADNIAQIVANQKHPKNYDASKFILQTYKSDLDDSMIAKAPAEVEFAIGGGGESKSSPIKITFGAKKLEE